MHRLVVMLPDDRRYAGTLRLEDASGGTVAGPFAVGGCADGAAARQHHNPLRDRLLPYGDTPLGRYRVTGVVDGRAAALPAARFGPHGIIVLEPLAGEAALADANGRFHLLIHGGPLAPKRRLRATDGALRLSNRDQKKLIDLLRRRRAVECECISMPQDAARRPIVVDAGGAEDDAPIALSALLARARGALAISGSVDMPSRRMGWRSSVAPPVFRLAADGGGGGGGGAGGGYGADDQPSTIPNLIGDALTSAGSKIGSTIDDAIDQAPSTILTHANTAIIDTFNSHLQQQGQPALSGVQANALRTDISTAVQPLADRLGVEIRDQMQQAAKASPSDDFTRKLRPSRATPTTTTKTSLSLGVGSFTLNPITGRPGVSYSVKDFAQLGSFKSAIAPLTSNLNKLSLGGSVNSADYSFNFSTTMTLTNPAGSLHFKDVSGQVGISMKFGGK